MSLYVQLVELIYLKGLKALKTGLKVNTLFEYNIAFMRTAVVKSKII